MPHTFSVTVSDAEYKSLQYAAVDPEDWVENAVTTRCQVGGDKIISLLVAHCNANNVQIATGRDAQITQAYTLEVVQTAQETQAAAMAATPSGE